METLTHLRPPFPDDIQMDFLELKCTNFDQISLKFVPTGSINDIPLFQTMVGAD